MRGGSCISPAGGGGITSLPYGGGGGIKLPESDDGGGGGGGGSADSADLVSAGAGSCAKTSSTPHETPAAKTNATATEIELFNMFLD